MDLHFLSEESLFVAGAETDETSRKAAAMLRALAIVNAQQEAGQ